MAYDNTNKGALYKNERRTQDNHPEYTGSINVDGKEYWLSAWIKEIQKGENKGKKYFSMTVKPKE